MKELGQGILALFVILFLITSCVGPSARERKESEAAYKRLKDAGYTTKEIYEMGKK